MKPALDHRRAATARQGGHSYLLHLPFSGVPEADAQPETFGAVRELLPANLLDGDEIVILAIKPSLWFVVFTSFRWLAAMTAVIVLVGRFGQELPFFKQPLVIQGAVALVAARVGFALLQWESVRWSCWCCSICWCGLRSMVSSLAQSGYRLR